MKHKGLVTKVTGSWYEVVTEKDEKLFCRLRGKLRLDENKLTNPVVVGDWVKLSKEENDWVIHEIEERKNHIIRQSPRNKKNDHIIAANIDQAVVMASIVQPRTSSGFIDRFLVVAEAYHIPAVIIFNKIDLVDKAKDIHRLEEWNNMYTQLKYPCYCVSVEQKENLNLLNDLFKGKISLLSGHSGVGKSSLVNQLAPEVAVKTGEISSKHNKGMHTTTFAEMLPLPFGGYIIDTPGIKEFGLTNFEPNEISHYFVEIAQYAAACKFTDCTHVNEPGCAVKKAVEKGEIHEERYQNYLNILIDYQENYKHWE